MNEVYNIEKIMLIFLVIAFTWILGHWGLSTAYDACRGDKQTLALPMDYDKDVPDSIKTNNITEVLIEFTIQRLRGVDEGR